MQNWHATWSTESRLPLAPDEVTRRAMVRAIARVAGVATSLFCVVDDHVHVVLFCTEAERGRRVQALSLAFAAISPVPLGPAHVRPVRDRTHMLWLANQYLLNQPAKHGLATHLALWSGSCFPDIAGARVLPGLTLRLADALPRWRPGDAYVAVGLPRVPLVPADDLMVRQAGASRLVAAAASAAGIDPTLSGTGAAVVGARLAVVAIGQTCGLATAELAFALRVTQQAVTRLGRRLASADAGSARREPSVPHAALLAATRMRLALEDAAARLPLAVREPPGLEYSAEPLGVDDSAGGEPGQGF